jgi:hypothetical protein
LRSSVHSARDRFEAGSWRPSGAKVVGIRGSGTGGLRAPGWTWSVLGSDRRRCRREGYYAHHDVVLSVRGCDNAGAFLDRGVGVPQPHGPVGSGRRGGCGRPGRSSRTGLGAEQELRVAQEVTESLEMPERGVRLRVCEDGGRIKVERAWYRRGICKPRQRFKPALERQAELPTQST